MANFNVRIYGYRGVSQIPQVHVTQFSNDSLLVNEEPYVFGQLIPTDGDNPVTSASDAQTGTKMLKVEVPDGKGIRYEVNLNGPAATNARVASTDSPKMEGVNWITFSPGATFSFVDAANFP